MKNISFDFDNILDREHIQNYAKELIERGLSVWVVTSRFDTDNCIKQFKTNMFYGKLVNNDLFDVAKKLDMHNEHIHFTNILNKWTFLKIKILCGIWMIIG